MTMTTTKGVPMAGRVLPAPRRHPVRLYLLRRSIWTMFTALTGAFLFAVWITMVAISPITIFAPLLAPVTGMVRAYTNAHRREASLLLGTPIPAPYRQVERRGPLSRVWRIVRDPASWRDALWLLLHTIVGCVTATVAVSLFVGTVFYLIYPFLFWVTPQSVFGKPFGGLFELHSVAQSTVMMSLALVTFGLWLALQVPLTRLELRLTRSLLGPRIPAQ